MRALLLSLLAISSLAGATPPRYRPVIAAANFPTSTTIDNPFFPLTPGTALRYRDSEGKTTDVTVTTDTKRILGIDCVVVRDTVKTAAGQLLEDTFDWYAQDKDGNVWYFGEDTRAFRNGRRAGTKGSWTAGVAGAQPGMIMPAHPTVGAKYRQEYLRGVAEDQAEVLSLAKKVTVPYGSFDHCIETRDFSDLEPGVSEHKFYCAGIGEVSAVDGENKHEDLISLTRR